MNRYVADGILDDVASGRVVLLVTSGGSHTSEALAQLEQRAQIRDLEGVTVRRSNGQESLTHAGGGRVVLVPVRGHAGRTWTADVLFVDGGVDVPVARFAELLPSVACSPWREVMRA